MKKLLNLFLPLVILAACGMNETSNDENTPTSNNTYFTEFMPCEAGPDFNSENMTKMISEWQKLLTANRSFLGSEVMLLHQKKILLVIQVGGKFNGPLKKLLIVLGRNGLKMKRL